MASDRDDLETLVSQGIKDINPIVSIWYVGECGIGRIFAVEGLGHVKIRVEVVYPATSPL